MKTLYLECNMGAAGDMLMAALLELHPAREDFLARLNGLGLPGVTVSAEKSVKCGVTGTHVLVKVCGKEEHDHAPHEEHHHSHIHTCMRDIENIVACMNVSDKVKGGILAVYQLIAAAESEVHGVPVEHIHLHEVGSLDALTDIAGVCMLMEELAPQRVLASPVCTGYGQVRCAHGILPVPAPATALIFNGVPIFGGAIEGELCTPTGAALLMHFVSEFRDMPVMRVSNIGYGMGSKDFAAANCLRALMGETGEDAEQIVELCCNIDDMTPEALGFAQEELFAGGALDVCMVPSGMKKNRPGVLLSCVCKIEKRDYLLRVLFRNTTTLGVREKICKRYTLNRKDSSVSTEYGTARVKTSAGWGVERWKAEYDDLADMARRNKISFAEATDAVSRAVNLAEK